MTSEQPGQPPLSIELPFDELVIEQVSPSAYTIQFRLDGTIVHQRATQYLGVGGQFHFQNVSGTLTVHRGPERPRREEFLLLRQEAGLPPPVPFTPEPPHDWND